VFAKFKTASKLKITRYNLEHLRGSVIQNALLTTNSRFLLPYILQEGRESSVGTAAVYN